MAILITAIIFIVVFSLLILIHEFGHFWAAKSSGIKVEEFGLGLPPRIWGKKRGETIYSINWIPFGGFVRMLGEDSVDPKTLKQKRSFIAQPMRTRAKVAVAGVTMNFFLAWLLMTIGFSVGMQPLLLSDDVLPAVDSGVIVLDEGVRVKEDFGSFKAEDVIYSFDGEVVDSSNFVKISEAPVGKFTVIRDNRMVDVYVEDAAVFSGLTFYDSASFPRVVVHSIDERSDLYRAGLRSGDVIISAGDREVFSVAGFEEAIRGGGDILYTVSRGGVRQEVLVEGVSTMDVIVSEVVPGTPAAEAGLNSGDVVVSVNGKEFHDSSELIEYVSGEDYGTTFAYLIDRDGERIFYEISSDETGKIGVYLSELVSYGEEDGISLYNANVLSSVLEIMDQQYPVYEAAYRAVGEVFRLSTMTAKMFVSFVRGLIGGEGVPDTVAGPVRIAQMTHVFVQEGVVPMIRFVAILSLSLAVVNILPFPALDGGRLLFIFIEWVSGRKVNQKLEAFAHTVGYLLLLALIVFISYNEILGLFRG